MASPLNNNFKEFFLRYKKRIILTGSLILFIFMISSTPPEGLSTEGWKTAAVAVLMALWWITEVIPIAATALLPLAIFPVLNIIDIRTTVIPYSNPVIFLFMGGFILAIAMQEWGLHRRIALNIIRFIGFNPKNIILGFMVSSAVLSMWVSNTASTIMMLPIALSVIDITFRTTQGGKDSAQYRNFAVALMLGIAYASSVGGIATVIGTPTNALLLGFLNDSYGIEISFAEWLLIGLPVAIIGLPVTFFTLVNIIFPLTFKHLPGGRDFILDEIKQLGKISRAEFMVAIIFVLTATLWIIRPFLEFFLPGISDAGIAIFASLMLFLTPIKSSRGQFLLNWKSAEKLPWGVLILFGGGLSLAGAIQQTGLAQWIGGYFSVFEGIHLIIIIFIITFVIIMFTELTSNVATVSAFLPIIGSVAAGMGANPLLLSVPLAIAASCAFMLPVATPPNAIVYGSGFVTIPQMAKAGILLNIFFTILITILTFFVFSLVIM